MRHDPAGCEIMTRGTTTNARLSALKVLLCGEYMSPQVLLVKQPTQTTASVTYMRT